MSGCSAKPQLAYLLDADPFAARKHQQLLLRLGCSDCALCTPAADSEQQTCIWHAADQGEHLVTVTRFRDLHQAMGCLP